MTNVDDHSASRSADALAADAPHLLDEIPAPAARRRALEEIVEATYALGLDHAAVAARVRGLARLLHRLEPEGAGAFRVTGDALVDNRVRARTALLALAAWPHLGDRDLTDGDQLTEAAGDLVCDLLHLVGEGGGDPLLCIDRGERHWRDEIAEAAAE